MERAILGELLENVVDNALRHAPAGGSIGGRQHAVPLLGSAATAGEASATTSATTGQRPSERT